MTHPTSLDAVILDYNGVIGLQPSRAHWLRLARTASWPEDDLTGFQRAFWNARCPYDAGQLSDLAYWARVLGAHPGPRLLRELRTADTAMWTETDESVLAVVRRAHATRVPMVLLSNAPAHLSTVLDTHAWRQMMTQALYSARLEVCKPDPAAYQHALQATGVRDPRRVLFVDDRADNCWAAHSLGMQTLHYTGSTDPLREALALSA
ncbi:MULTISPECIES: HAD family phosphatase [unclassified Streptomyces]|uniref:HAD family hydrolase n=1 Tax=unclassified Streptomyces TaxID=2593676 RepID=UPI003326184D